jgi:hypothetical protein
VRPKPNCFQKMAPRIRLYGFRHLKNEAAAEDHVLQVLITTLEALRAGRLLEPEKLASFVLGTCRMMVLDERRGALGEICSVGKLRYSYAMSKFRAPGAAHHKIEVGNSWKKRERQSILFNWRG